MRYFITSIHWDKAYKLQRKTKITYWSRVEICAEINSEKIKHMVKCCESNTGKKSHSKVNWYMCGSVKKLQYLGEEGEYLINYIISFMKK